MNEAIVVLLLWQKLDRPMIVKQLVQHRHQVAWRSQ